MARTQYNVDKLKAEAVKPLFAAAGAAELAVDFARGRATEAQKGAQDRLDALQARIAKVERDPKALQGQARQRVNARVDELAKEAREAQARFEARLKDLQKEARDFPQRVQSQLDEALEELAQAYAELAGRGEKFVAALRKDGVKAVTAVKNAPSKSTTVRRQRAVAASSNGATRTAPAKKTSAGNAPAKKTAAKKSTAKKATAKKTTAKKTTAKKTTAASA
jgi:DNA repair exonuclease SbcCD ATPase subunit